MDKLKECAIEFKKLFGKDYFYILENGKIIKLYFASKHFHHLMGLHKLTDIPSLVTSPRNTPTAIFKNIIKSKISYNTIIKSSFFNEINDRIDNFHYINKMVFEKVIIDFDNAKVPSSKPSKIKSDLILFQDKNSFYLNLCLKNSTSSYIPETFLVQCDDYYIKNQNILNIKEFKVHSSKNNKILYHKIYTDKDAQCESPAIN